MKNDKIMSKTFHPKGRRRMPTCVQCTARKYPSTIFPYQAYPVRTLTFFFLKGDIIVS
jgi:hypothetical protein